MSSIPPPPYSTATVPVLYHEAEETEDETHRVPISPPPTPTSAPAPLADDGYALPHPDPAGLSPLLADRFRAALRDPTQAHLVPIYRACVGACDFVHVTNSIFPRLVAEYLASSRLAYRAVDMYTIGNLAPPQALEYDRYCRGISAIHRCLEHRLKQIIPQLQPVHRATARCAWHRPPYSPGFINRLIAMTKFYNTMVHRYNTDPPQESDPTLDSLFELRESLLRVHDYLCDSICF